MYWHYWFVRGRELLNSVLFAVRVFFWKTAADQLFRLNRLWNRRFEPRWYKESEASVARVQAARRADAGSHRGLSWMHESFQDRYGTLLYDLGRRELNCRYLVGQGTADSFVEFQYRYRLQRNSWSLLDCLVNDFSELRAVALSSSPLGPPGFPANDVRSALNRWQGYFYQTVASIQFRLIADSAGIRSTSDSRWRRRFAKLVFSKVSTRAEEVIHRLDVLRTWIFKIHGISPSEEEDAIWHEGA